MKIIKNNWYRFISVLVLLAFLLLGLPIMGYHMNKEVKAAVSNDPTLFLIAKDSPDPNCYVYVYRYYDGHGGYYTFVVASRNYKDGVSVTQIK